MAQHSAFVSSYQPDVRILVALGRLQRLLLPVVWLVSGVIFLAWLLPLVGRLLPVGWTLMKANTAALILLSGVSIFLSQPRRSPNAVLAARMIGGFVALLSVATLAEYLWKISLGVDTLVAADALSPIPGRMSAQTAVSFVLFGLVLLNLRAKKGVLSYLADGLTFVLCLLMFVFLSGYVFGAMRLFGLAMNHRLSPQTLFCLCLLCFFIFNRRVEYGIFSILVDDGIGGKTARLAGPCALLLPFAMAMLRGLFQRFHLITEQYGEALAAAIISLLCFSFILFVSSRCRALEGEARELSLRDQLTQLYNRRGFYLLAEQSLKLAQRSGYSFFLFFIDMDNLKLVNDSQGHTAGSELLQDMAGLLRKTFRATDLLGRLGGDEFVVAGRAEHPEIMSAITRLEENARLANSSPHCPYPLSFSLGYVVSDGNVTETLTELLERADSMMYEAKRSKKQRA